MAQRGGRFAVIGGGFIGSEIAATLVLNGVEVVMVSPEAAIGARAFAESLAAAVTSRFRHEGVDVLTRTSVTDIQPKGDQMWLELKGPTTRTGHGILVDGVVAGIGIEPNLQLARKASLEVENGIAVNQGLRTSHPDIYAAGDVASFPSLALGKRVRVEHGTSPTAWGTAGRNMAGGDETYRHIAFFYSDLFDMGYEAVGDIDSRLATVDWKEPYREGVVHFLRQGRVPGVLLWNVWDRVEAARQLTTDPGPFRSQDLQGCPRQ
jgi:NADPH-dependent 2,4-dienoyl-CoA reductase/sulfur reductase-like enzyme